MLDHYDPEQCLKPLWCFIQPNVANGVKGEMRGAECFEPPMKGAFRVRRINYTIAKLLGAPQIRFQVRGADVGAKPLYESEPVAAAVGAGSHEIPADQQPLIMGGRFCVGFVGGNQDTSVGVAVDDSELPAAEQSYAGSTACGSSGLKDVNTFNPEINPHGAWCLGAEVSGA